MRIAQSRDKSLADRKNHMVYLLLILLFLSNVLIQIALQQNGLDNQPVNDYNPAAGDAFGYVKRAERLAKYGDFVDTFKDGYRLPGYPFFLSVFYHFSARPLLSARYAQIVLSALTIILLFFALLNICSSTTKALLGALIVALWVPLYYFSPLLGAESCSIFLFGVFLYCLSRLTNKTSLPIIYTLPVLLALWVYLKPQHILLFPAFVAFLMVKIRGIPLRHLVGVALTLTALLAPWSIFASLMNRKFVPLSTTSGLMLYLGTGVDTSRDDSLMGTLPLKMADRLEVRDKDITQQIRRDIEGMSDAEKSEHFTKFAIETWIAKPIRTGLYGLSKVFHGYGFSFRGFRDLVLTLFFVSSMVLSVYLWVSNSHREWCVFFGAILFVTSLQLFVFAPDQRYKTVMFDLPALMIIILGILTLFENRGSRFSGRL
jgi:hypothetical protein